MFDFFTKLLLLQTLGMLLLLKFLRKKNLQKNLKQPNSGRCRRQLGHKNQKCLDLKDTDVKYYCKILL